MLFGYIVGAILLVAGIGLIYVVVRSMGLNGIEAAAPGSCRSGRCGVTPKEDQQTEATTVAHVSMDEIVPKDRQPSQPPRQ